MRRRKGWAPSRFRERAHNLESTYKPDPVPTSDRRTGLDAGGGHPSGADVADDLLRPTRGLRAGHPYPLLGLAPDGVYLAAPVARHAGELLPHRFTLTS
jgi:hypothetical protein